MFLAIPVTADQLIVQQNPRLEIYANRDSYYAGEKGIITAEIETYGIIRQAEIELEILSPEGKLIYGNLLYTEIPQKSILNPYTEQTEQILYHENIEYMGPEKIVKRNIDFEVPIDAVTGTYTMNMILRTPEIELKKSGFLYISGGGQMIDFIILIYIVILIFSLYLIWRG